MKARLFVVDSNTIKSTLKSMEASVLVPDAKNKNGKAKFWNKTLLDIVCDLLQLSIGDYVFLWESGTENIYGVYRVLSHPYFVKQKNRNDIFRIKIGVAYDFSKPINEYEIINNPYMKSKLWNIIGKKVAGKARGTTPLTQDESQFLIQALIAANENYDYIEDYTEIPVKNEILFDFVNEYNAYIPDYVKDYKYKPIEIFEGSEVKYEKALEGVLNCCFRDSKEEIIKHLDINVKKVVWFANYLPYGLERSEIDYMVMESEDGENITKIDVIELMSGVIDEDHINRCLQYSKWVASSLTNDKNIVRPILICGRKSVGSKRGFNSTEIQDALRKKPSEYGYKELEVYTYARTKSGIEFKKKE